METNYIMLKRLNEKYIPKKRGFSNSDEIKLIEDTLHIQEMNELQLRNLRDFTVMFYSEDCTIDNMDKMSAIVYIIDTATLNEKLKPN